jgi:thiol-disulfide isomerase/thioredoxin
MTKNLFLTALVISLAFGSFNPALSQSEKVEVLFFFTNTCPHCAEEKKFLASLEKRYPQVEIKRYELPQEENISFLKELYQKYEVPQEKWGLVPVTFIEDRYFVGYGTHETSGKEIENYLRTFFPDAEEPEEWLEASLEQIRLPFFGEIDVSDFSPLTLAVALGTLDGFNACAMVALGFLLSVLIATGTRKRIILIGGTFILVSGLVYFLFISAWLNLFLFLSNVKFITTLVGIIIVISALFLLKEYFMGIVCRICEVNLGKEGILTKIEKGLLKQMERFSSFQMPLPLALLGIAAVAAGVNMVELSCSLGLPLAFTKILTGWQLSKASYYFYLFIYILFYMIDDFLIFLVAVFTLRMSQASRGYLKAIKLISSVLLLILGLVMLINPAILTLS